MKEATYWERTDRFEEKLRLLESAWKSRKFELARSLAASIRDTASFAQQEEDNPGTPLLGAAVFGRVEELPAPWNQWARGWRYCKALALDETVGMARAGEPVELLAGFRAEQTASLAREVRVARIESGTLREIPCQVCGELRRGPERLCRLILLADSPPHVRTSYLIFYGNPDAELPAYVTDLNTSGEGYGLDIENHYYRASLSRQMGQLERLTLKREHGLELFSGGEGHGEPPGIDWAHDYVASGNFQKFRLTNWPECPDYQVIRGPLCVAVRRWGFPYSTVHPLFTPSRMHFTVEYRFYAGLPYFIKQGSVEVVKDLEITYLRDDEWVFSGYSFTDTLWMGGDGKLRSGPVAPGQEENLWAEGIFHRQSRDAFIALRLEHGAERFEGLKHSGSPVLHYRLHGQLWSRWAARGDPRFQAGAVLKQKNAYLVLPFPEQGGADLVEGYRHRLLHPLAAGPGERPRNPEAAAPAGSLARPGEAGDSPIDKRRIGRRCANARMSSSTPWMLTWWIWGTFPTSACGAAPCTSC